MLLDKTIHIPDLGDIGADSGFHVLNSTETVFINAILKIKII